MGWKNLLNVNRLTPNISTILTMMTKADTLDTLDTLGTVTLFARLQGRKQATTR